MIDGVRYGFTAHADGSIWVGIIFLALLNCGLWFFALHLLRIGYKLKA